MNFPWLLSAKGPNVSGGGTPTFNSEVLRAGVYDGNTSETYTLTTGIPSGKMAVIMQVQASGEVVTSASDSKGNTWTVRQTVTDGFVSSSIVTSYLTTALGVSDTVTLNRAGTTYCGREISLCYVDNATSYDTGVTANVFASAVSLSATTVNGVCLGVINGNDSTRTYSGGAWTTIGSVQDYGFANSRRAYFIYKNVSAGSQNPGGSWSVAVQQENAWVSVY